MMTTELSLITCCAALAVFSACTKTFVLTNISFKKVKINFLCHVATYMYAERENDSENA